MYMKKLVASFFLIASQSTIALAQDRLTLYGIIDIGLQYTTVRQTSDRLLQSNQFFGVSSGVQSGSRFGLRGTHEMGGGFETVFTLENGFNAGTGEAQQGGRLFGRQSALKTTILASLILVVRSIWPLIIFYRSIPLSKALDKPTLAPHLVQPTPCAIATCCCFKLNRSKL